MRSSAVWYHTSWPSASAAAISSASGSSAPPPGSPVASPPGSRSGSDVSSGSAVPPPQAARVRALMASRPIPVRMLSLGLVSPAPLREIGTSLCVLRCCAVAVMRVSAHVTFRRAVVGAQRADKGVVGQLLHDVGGPPGDAAGDEQRGEDLGVEAHE